MPFRKYILVVNGKPKGPFTIEELKEFDVKSDSFIKTPELEDYKEAHEFPEIRELFDIAKQYTAPQYFAGFDLRLLASCLDWFIVISVVLFFELIIIIIGDFQSEIKIFFIANLIILPLVKFGYHIITETIYQATLGKRALNIKVTDLNGLKPDFNKILIRNISKILSSLILFIGYLYSFLNKKHQCLHDVFANTLVIKDRLI